MKSKKQTFYQCPICKLWYQDKKWAEKCEAWCKEHKSCNLEIIKHAIKIKERNNIWKK